MDISVEDLVNKIREIFNSSKVRSVERKQVGEKLVISINGILYDDINIIYTKLIFYTDDSKLTKNHFSYLYDINCEYVRVEFSDLKDFSTKIEDLFKKSKFGENIRTLSKFVKSPATLINEWFQQNGVTDLSITNVKEEKISIMPCESLFFSFVIDLNNNQNVRLEISKEKEKEYIYQFKVFGKVYEDKQTNLNSLIETIGKNLKNNVKM